MALTISAGCAIEAEDEAVDAPALGSIGTPLAADAACRAERRAAACKRDPRVRLNLVSLETCIGADLFFRETFAGNGRTCGSCHPANNNFTLDASFISKLKPNDPLFIAENDAALADLEKPELLRQFGLITVNPDGFEDPTHKFAMRSVSHTFSLSTTLTIPPSEEGAPRTIDGTTRPPNDRLGWSGDGAPGKGELRDFADGAIVQHATKSLARTPDVDFVLPTDAERDAMAEFQRNLGRKNELDLNLVRLTDPAAERGRVSFVSGAGQECNLCHQNAGANMLVTDTERNLSFLSNFTFDVGTERARLGVLNDLGVPFDGGFGLRAFDSDGDGTKDAFGNRSFNAPPLIEAADTGPFFHTHAFQSIEDAIAFYTSEQFGKSLSGRAAPTRPNGGPFVLTPEDIADLGGFLRVLNAAFNCQLAIPRLEAALKISAEFNNQYLSIQRGLLELANAEILDALEVLTPVGVNTNVQTQLTHAKCEIEAALGTHNKHRRRELTKHALEILKASNAGLGQGITFEIGEGTLMF